MVCSNLLASPQRNIEMVAIVRNNYSANRRTSGAKLCHIGFEANEKLHEFDFYYTAVSKNSENF